MLGVYRADRGILSAWCATGITPTEGQGFIENCIFTHVSIVLLKGEVIKSLVE